MAGARPFDVARVSVDEPPLAMDVGLNDAVAPVGTPLALREIEPVNPFNAEVLTVKLPFTPGVITIEPGVGLRLKSGMTAVPFKAILWGFPGALSESETVPARAPAMDGVNVMLIVQLTPAASEVPQLFVCE